MVSRKMNVYEYPTHQELDSLLSRPAHDASHLTATVSAVLEDVRLHGDQAVIKYEKQFDHAELTDLVLYRFNLVMDNFQSFLLMTLLQTFWVSN